LRSAIGSMPLASCLLAFAWRSQTFAKETAGDVPSTRDSFRGVDQIIEAVVASEFVRSVTGLGAPDSGIGVHHRFTPSSCGDMGEILESVL
jgi:hypothetical protein